MKLKIGNRHTVEVKSLEEASRVYCDLRDQSGEGSSTWPEGKIDRKFRVSYNGKVWDREWMAGDLPVFDPYAQVA